MKKLVAALACRNDGSRLYGKPMQNLDIENKITVLQYMINLLKTIPVIEGIVLGISEGVSNLGFIEVAKKNGLAYIIGDEKDVLGRLIQCAERGRGTDIFRLSTESPYTHFDAVEAAWKDHVSGDFDFSCLDNLPVGCAFEMIKVEALKYSHFHGEDRHRSEFCSWYIRENKDKFKIQFVEPEASIKGRTDLRLTIDYPEDLVLCRSVYSHFKTIAPRISVPKIVRYLDQNPPLKQLVAPYLPQGLKMAYL